MSEPVLILSPKFRAFLREKGAALEALEGTTAAGKTTVGACKFLLRCAQSPKRLHLLAAEDAGTAERNIISRDKGLMELFGGSGLAEYQGGGSTRYKTPHIALHSRSGEKTVFVVGYRDRSRWKDVLGGQFGCLYIDEANTADMDFVREAVMRADYTIMTLNPDDPGLPIYTEYINRCRPLPAWADKTPEEIRKELTEPEHPGWVHWFFSFDDNAALTREKRRQIIESVPKGTKLWKNKIEGMRGRAAGLVFPSFDRARHVRAETWGRRFIAGTAEGERFTQFSCGVDTAYSARSPDTIAMCFLGITNLGRCIVLDEKTYNNAELHTPLAPSDTVRSITDFLDRNRGRWGFCREAFIDSADQATITEAAKFRRTTGCVYSFLPAWKRERIIDRINCQLGWMAGDEPRFYVLEACPTYIRELETYCWREDRDNTPQDGGDHMINAVQYAWLPYEGRIGTVR